MLTLEVLEAREVPTTLADIIGSYDPLTFDRPMPDVPAEQILVATADLDPHPAGDRTRWVDVYAAHGDGNAARIVVRDAETHGRVLFNFYAYEDTFRGGVKDLAVIGTDLFVTPGKGGGPVVAVVDLLTGSVRTVAVPGFAESWRGGLRIASADVDFQNVAGSGDPAEELIVLAASPGAGPVVSVLERDGGQALPPFLFADPAGRDEWDFVPAGVGVQVAPGAAGMLLENARDRLTTVRVGWDGVVYPNTTAPEDYAAADPLPLGGVYVG